MARLLWPDLRFALRLLARHRVSSIAAALALCFGIGPTTAIFSIVYATLLAPLPYPHPEQLVMVWSQVRGGRNVVSAADYLEWKARATSFQYLDVFIYRELNLATAEEPERIPVRLVSANGYRLHGDPVLLGRDFLPEETQPGKDRVVILSHSLWSRRFGADRGIIGRDIRLDSEPYTVIGVLQPGMYDRLGADAWLPLAFTQDQLTHEARSLLVLGRLKPDVTRAQAQEEMRLITANLATRYPSSNTGWSASVEPLQNNFLSPTTRANLWLLMAAVSLVVLIACVDVANLLLARATARERELALRASLGATRAHLVRQTLTESLVLAAAGGALGVLSAVWLLRGLLALLPLYTLPAESDPRLNLPVLLFALAATVIAGLVFGVMPAWHATRVDLHHALRQGGRTAVPGTRRGLRTLVVAELALAVSLLAGAGLTIQSFWNRTQVDLGVVTDRLLTFDLLAQQGRLEGTVRIDAFYRTLLERLEAIPGVSRAAVTTSLPLFTTRSTDFTIVGRPPAEASARPAAAFRAVTPGFFDTFGVRVVRGRAFTARDDAGGARVAMVNERFAARFFEGRDPLRERLLIPERRPGAMGVGAPIEWQIVGVFHNVGNGQAFGDPESPEIDVPFSQSPWPQVSGAVRTAGDPQRTRQAIVGVVRSLDAALPVSNVRTMRQIVGERLAPERLNMALFIGLAGVALLLAAVGIYGVMAFLVEQRTSEIGLRMALGADRAQVLRRILREGLILAAAGLAVGLIGAYAVGFAMRGTLYGTGTLNPVVLAAVCATLLATAFAACYVPARRASAVDPMSALRQL